jgi:hypothetical protein
MVTRSARSTVRRAGWSGRRAANSPVLSGLARAGFAARGVLYVIIGALALEVAFGSHGHQADKTGALRLVGKTPLGEAALWLLAIGFAGLALWQAAEAIWGGYAPRGREAGRRLGAAARAVFYGAVAFSIMKYAIGLGAPKSSDKQSRDLTASLMHHPGGRFLAGAIGAGLIIAGAVVAYGAWRKKFLRHMSRLSTASPAARQVVERLGQYGGICRGAVFAGAGVFVTMAAVNANPGEAKGVDATLRAFAATPAGPWLLVLVATGLIVYGVYCGCEARWRDT